MSSRSARRSALVLALNLAVGLAAVVVPTLSHAAGARSEGHVTASAHPTTVLRVRVRHAQLVRNPGFQDHRKFWAVRGHTDTRVQVARPGYHSGHAARLVVKRRGAGGVREMLGQVHAKDHYWVSANVKRIGGRSHPALELKMYRRGRFVGQRSTHIRLRNHRWTTVHLAWTSGISGVRLAVAVVDRSPRADRGVKLDNIRVWRTRRVIVRVPVTAPTPAPSGSPAPTPTASSTPTASPTPTPTVSASAAPTPTPTSSPSSTPTVAAPPVPPPTSSCSVSRTLVPSCGVYWGAYTHPTGSENWETAFTDLEAQSGTKLDIVYRYHDFSGTGTNGAFPDAYEQKLAASGHLLMDNWQSDVFATHAVYSWADVAAGKFDASVIDPEAARIKAFGKPIFIGFDHEMDSQVGTEGTPADYVAAYRHIHDRFAALGVTNVIWVWTIEGQSGHDYLYKSLYPGDAYVDWIGYDPYNFATCHGTAWKSFDQTVTPDYQWLEANGFGDKPFMLPEYGTVPDPSNANAAAAWYGQIQSTLNNDPNIKALLAWDSSAGGCDTQLTGPGEMSAFGQAGRSVQP